MSNYHLQARRAICGAPGRRKEETRLVEADDLDSATRTAEDLASDGFTVWIFRRTARPRLSASPQPLRLVTTVDPPRTEHDDRVGRPARAPGPPHGPRGRVADVPDELEGQRALRRVR